MSADRSARERARASLEGLAAGDAFGQTFFADPHTVLDRIRGRELPPAPWIWTDDTAMGIDVVRVLEAHGDIDQEALARQFGESYRRDPWRGYGPAMHSLLEQYVTGFEWLTMAPGLFGGTGSFGNGSAMRVAPIGAWFADDLDAAAEAASASAAVTHAHPEASAGAVAVALATAIAVAQPDVAGSDLLATIVDRLGAGAVREGVARAIDLGFEAPGPEAAFVLGNGSEISCQDTVPFTLWCAARHLADFEEAQWVTVSGLGDRDTTCAIVGGILGARLDSGGVPPEWMLRRETLDGIPA